MYERNDKTKQHQAKFSCRLPGEPKLHTNKMGREREEWEKMLRHWPQGKSTLWVL